MTRSDASRDGAPADAPAASISLSLVSHTNVGKTTLARTLLGRDIGTVRDAPHVTASTDAHPLIETPDGDALRLWDTPGFGDSARLARRMRQSGNPIGWFLSQVWDRYRDRPFWASQQALRHVQADSDVVLYLVSAAEEPAAAGYVGPEMELLAWIGKPVVVLLNQLGPPRGAALEEADVQRWRQHLAGWPLVRAVLPLDAFARCWVQEFALLEAIDAALPPERRAAMRRLSAAWRARRLASFDAAMAALAHSLAAIATTRRAVEGGGGLKARLREVGASLGLGDGDTGATADARRALADALDAQVRASTAELIVLHGLEGEAQGEILARLASQFELRQRVGEGPAAVWGGVLTGALAGLKADLATGGLTLGGGMLAGGLLGALGAAGLARAYNLVRGTDRSWLSWNAEALGPMVEAALLRYLAVAHFGRGRGQWERAEAPPHWRDEAAAALAPYRDALDELWRGRRFGGEADTQALADALQPVLADATRDLLERLYPGALAAGG